MPDLTPVPRHDACSISDFDSQVAALGLPVVITAGADRSTTLASWTLTELAARFGHVKVPVLGRDSNPQDALGDSGSMKPRRMMSLADYIRCISSDAGTAPYAGNISLRNDPAVAGRLADLLCKCRFPDWLPGSAQDEYRMWIAAAGQLTGIHNDPYHNFNAQLIGTKRFVLFAPDQHEALYAEFFNSGMWTSPIDPTAADLQKYPKFAAATGYECELQPGDILFLPRFWWHYVQARKVSVNINRWIVPDDARWHQQPQARRFISYPKLLAQVTAQFESLPAILQEFKREEFERLRAELATLIDSDVHCERSEYRQSLNS